MIQVIRFEPNDPEASAMARAIRHKVFVEEQGVDPELEYSGDEEAHHYLMLIGGNAIGTARWRKTEKGIKLERFAVLPAFRNRGFGEVILREVLNDVTGTGEKIYLHSQVLAVPFYGRNGFQKIGEMFVEAGIDHFYMEWVDPGHPEPR
jgi:predicted GNAT family N-acyltransferase